jgi:hypothetical protein
MVPLETCAECGFDGGAWTDTGAIAVISELPDRWHDAVDGLAPPDLQRRSDPTMWSIAEYVDHVRETLFGARFLLDTAMSSPGADLGEAPQPRFDPVPRAIDVPRSLAGLASEARHLHDQLRGTPSTDWTSSVIVSGGEVDVHWIARHAVHDATHHLQDVQRLRSLL